MWTYLENYFNLKKSFVFYGSYHHEWRNQLVHVLFVQVIFTTALSLASHTPITDEINLSHPVAAFYALSFIIMEPVAGTLYAPLIGAMQHIAQNYLRPRVGLTVALHLIGWVSQIVAHRFYERRAPAFTEDPLQAIHAAVFFVWLEVLYYLGYRPKDKAELDKLVEARIKKMEADEAAARKAVPATTQ